MRFTDFLNENHRRTHKWDHYFAVYDQHFSRFRNRYLTLFEIGLGEGGSLQLWKRHLGPFARIVGIDVEPACKQLEEEQIEVRIGSQDDRGFLADVLAEFGPPDIVIDDGSHLQDHVNTTFDVLFPHVAKNGIYLVEDLHAAYWSNHGGGLRHRNSFIERAKGYVDEMHAQYTGGELERSALGDRLASIHFYDSIVVLEVGEYRVRGHRITGDAALFRADWTADAMATPEPELAAPPVLHACETAPPAPEVLAPEVLAPEVLAPEVPDIDAARQAEEEQMQRLQSRIGMLERENSLLRASTSWRITEPLRRIGGLVKPGRPR